MERKFVFKPPSLAVVIAVVCALDPTIHTISLFFFCCVHPVVVDVVEFVNEQAAALRETEEKRKHSEKKSSKLGE